MANACPDLCGRVMELYLRAAPLDLRQRILGCVTCLLWRLETHELGADLQRLTLTYSCVGILLEHHLIIALNVDVDLIAAAVLFVGHRAITLEAIVYWPDCRLHMSS